LGRRIKNKFVGLYVDSQLYEVLKNRASILNITVSEMVRMILTQVLSKEMNHIKINNKKIVEIDVGKIYLIEGSERD
jgi:antitoxin component of RelBE/YafQ-DinJ toxin-antitoxin module